MRFLRATLLAVVLATALSAQTEFSTISEPHARAEAVRAARKQLAGRTDSDAIAQWRAIMAEMHLSRDPELSVVVQDLRAMNLYNNDSWANLVNMGYAYTEDSESARRFRAELARRRPDSSWAIQKAIEEWESTHQPKNTTQAGFIEFGLARLEFLKRLHEEKPDSEAAAQEYLQTAFYYQSHLPLKEALAVADMALKTGRITRFQVAELYLHHRMRLDEVPRLLNEAVQDAQRDYRRRPASSRDAEALNRRIVLVQLQAHCDLAEYWLLKNTLEEARTAARQARADLARLAPPPDAPRNQQALFEAVRKRWVNLAGRVGIEVEPQANEVDWAKVARVPLENFETLDLAGRRWTLEQWKGKVVLVNMWATWCGPCRAELPYIQKLHEALRGRADRLVISINVDSDADLARRLVREHGYTFPVLMSRRLADQIDFERGVPQNRIVDGQGRLLAEPVEGTGDAWVEMVQALMNQVT